MFSVQNQDSIEEIFWYRAATVEDFPENSGACIKYQDQQIAVFNFKKKKQWYACQNLCPHKQQMILAEGIIGDSCGEPKVACPFHKKSFSLITGENLSGEDYSVKTYPVKIENGYVYIGI
jgi:nitrite reductase (NADH) small subunit